MSDDIDAQLTYDELLAIVVSSLETIHYYGTDDDSALVTATRKLVESSGNSYQEFYDESLALFEAEFDDLGGFNPEKKEKLH
jgi:hypothetical protein